MKKQNQLGMNPSTASNRLVKDLLFKFVVAAGHKCHRCGQALTRETFSIDHKIAWLDSSDPLKLFFDLDNIAFSHNTCNYSAARNPRRGQTKYPEHIKEGARRVPSQIHYDQNRVYDPVKRHEQYLRTGK